MSKTLYLLRHGLALDPNGVGTKADHARELSPQGCDEISRLGQLLSQREDFSPHIALVSSAIRTRQTAERIPLNNVQIRDDYYNADLAGLIAPLRELQAQISSALIVAHNPAVSWLGASLLQPSACRGFSPGSLLALQIDGAWEQIKPGCAQSLWRFDPPYD